MAWFALQIVVRPCFPPSVRLDGPSLKRPSGPAQWAQTVQRTSSSSGSSSSCTAGSRQGKRSFCCQPRQVHQCAGCDGHEPQAPMQPGAFLPASCTCQPERQGPQLTDSLRDGQQWRHWCTWQQDAQPSASAPPAPPCMPPFLVPGPSPHTPPHRPTGHPARREGCSMTHRTAKTSSERWLAGAAHLAARAGHSSSGRPRGEQRTFSSAAVVGDLAPSSPSSPCTRGFVGGQNAPGMLHGELCATLLSAMPVANIALVWHSTTHTI